MRGLPKIAIARLKAKPEAPKSSGVPSGSVAFEGSPHPDANLLSAFVEMTLTGQERAQVMNHLSQCADCREVAAFIVPPAEVIAEPARRAAWWRSNPWLVLRWGAMAAVLGALTIVAVLHPGMWNRHPEVSKLTPPPVPAGSPPGARQTVSPPPIALPSAETARAEAPGEAHGSAGEVATAGEAPALQPSLTLHDQMARAKAGQQVTMMASTRPPATFRAERGLSTKTGQEESRGDNALTTGAAVEPAPPSAPAAAPAPAPEVEAKANAEAPAGRANLHSASQSVAVSAGAQPLQTTNANVSPAGGVSGPRPEVSGAAKAGPRAVAQANGIMASRASLREMAASHKAIQVATAPSASLWSVSSDGQVQCSVDGGKTFQPIPVASGIKILATADLGKDVWVGGAGGALFHSRDGGATWNRVAINFGGNAVTETITGIQLRDPEHLTVITASGPPWVSEDGGLHWQKQP